MEKRIICTYFCIISFTLLSISIFTQSQIVVDSIETYGRHGIEIVHVDGFGINIKSAKNNAINLEYCGEDGIVVDSVAVTALAIHKAGGTGVYVGRSGGRGFYLREAKSNGIEIDHAGEDGILVEGAGGYSLNIQGNRSLNESTTSHIAQIFNASSEDNADVLNLKVGEILPTEKNNFITFYQGNNKAVGRVEGNKSGGIVYGTTGADYAECLPRLYKEEILEAGDVVGIFEGHVTRKTKGATNIMVITGQPAVLGNQLNEDSELNENVSFIGQVAVRVIGKVKVGDWIIPSGREEGTALALPTSKISPDYVIIGQAWESNMNPEIKRVNTVVGLDVSRAKNAIISRMEQELNNQLLAIQNLQIKIDELNQLLINR